MIKSHRSPDVMHSWLGTMRALVPLVPQQVIYFVSHEHIQFFLEFSTSFTYEMHFTLSVSVHNRCSRRTCYSWPWPKQREKRLRRHTLLAAIYLEPLHLCLMENWSCRRICTKRWLFVRLVLNSRETSLLLRSASAIGLHFLKAIFSTISNKCDFLKLIQRLGHRTQILKYGRACASSLTPSLDLLVWTPSW